MLMAEDRVLAARHHRGEQPGFGAQRGLPDGEHPGSDAVQAADSKPVGDRTPPDAQPSQLPDSDQPVLAGGEPRDPLIYMHEWSVARPHPQLDHRCIDDMDEWQSSSSLGAVGHSCTVARFPSPINAAA